MKRSDTQLNQQADDKQLTDVFELARLLDNPKTVTEIDGGMLYSAEFGSAWTDIAETTGQELVLRAFPPLVHAVRTCPFKFKATLKERLTHLGFDTDSMQDDENQKPQTLPFTDFGPLWQLQIMFATTFGRDLTAALYPRRILDLAVADGEIARVNVARFEEYDGKESYRGI